MDLGLADRAFLVTAASGGLGLATARILVAEGARVVLVARRSDVLSEVVTELGEDRATSVAGDLRAADVADRAARAALERFGRLDGALISVGGPPPGSVLDTTEADWRIGFESVFLAGLRTARVVVERASAAEVALAFVLSTSVKSPLTGLAISNGLRPGLGIMIKQLADELGPRGGRVVGLMPGRIETERVRQLDRQAADPRAHRLAAEAAIPLRRYGRPEEFGRVAAFALSPAASYVTGSMIAVEGGALRAL